MSLRESATLYFKGNQYAVEYIVDLFQAWHIWDDFIDKDKPITDEDINKSYLNAFINIPRNPFYQANFSILNPLMEVAFINWIAANKLEKEKKELDIAYELRNINLNILVTCATIIGGIEWGEFVAVDIRKQLEKNDSLEHYKAELNKEHIRT